MLLRIDESIPTQRAGLDMPKLKCRLYFSTEEEECHRWKKRLPKPLSAPLMAGPDANNECAGPVIRESRDTHRR